ncbi:HEAT repeat domain-containing protein [Ulvibacterium sp.]|uniref:HEAT repeat domain-containing protein n=1 Tax=Ulvibacterium sp. TaxID=2665914 RepID=UPI0026112BE0|nr:HEAT repeat domain-containing protein [Ulvibacterium sp.]
MDKKQVIDLLPDYLDGVLDPVLEQKVEAYLKECPECREELEQLKTLFDAFANEEVAVPSHRVEASFLELLEQEKRKAEKVVPLNSKEPSTRPGWENFLKVAASIAALVGSFLLGQYLQERQSHMEIAALQEEGLELRQTAMLSLMENKSASRRIQGVNYIDAFGNPDETIVRALTDRMLHDENTNVRMASVEALEKFTASEIVKNAFIKALKVEKDPGIQIAIIQTLVRIQEKKAVTPLKELMQQDETQPFVKEQIESLLPSII